jgi:small subunit ribosomal protein S20
MPIIESAKKALRVSNRKKLVNDVYRKKLKETTKAVMKAVKTDKAEAKKLLSKAYQAIDKAAKRGVIKKNTASRRKSRLSKVTK